MTYRKKKTTGQRLSSFSYIRIIYTPALEFQFYSTRKEKGGGGGNLKEEKKKRKRKIGWLKSITRVAR